MSMISSLAGRSGANIERDDAKEAGASDPIIDEIGDGNKGTGEGHRKLVGLRWPKQETLALLKIRSNMDIEFRESNLKGPLWESISRKLAELGYNRSAKKCKEKFENLYKYHKRRKEIRAAKPSGKAYRFSNQLEAIDSGLSLQPPASENFQLETGTTVTSLTTTNPQNISQITVNLASVQHINTSNFISTSMSSSSLVEISDEKKRKWSIFFENLTEQVVRKQESYQNKFMKAMEQLEHQRMVREEAWRRQDMERVNREHNFLKERLFAVNRHASVVKFLEKISEEQNILQLKHSSLPTETIIKIPDPDDVQSSMEDSSRWPKSEVQALINIRSALKRGYRVNAAKVSLWEEISLGMRKLGFNRSAKKCKEKWENMNKYFKRVKESSKERPEDSKTCPYYHQLDAFYKDKMDKVNLSLSPSFGSDAEGLVMHTMRPSKRQSELHQQEQFGSSLPTEDLEGESVDKYYKEEDQDEDVKNDEAKEEVEVDGTGSEYASHNLSSTDTSE